MRSMTKKAFAEYNKKKRCLVGMNTGTRTHKSERDYSRQKEKLNAKRTAMTF